MPIQPASIQRVSGTLYFPELCAVHGTGPAESPLSLRTEKLLFFPYWSLLLVPFGLIPFLIAFVLMRREQTVTYYLSPSGLATVRKNRALIGGVMLVAVATMVIAGFGALWVLWFTIFALGLAAYLYRKINFPFEFDLDADNLVVVHRLPRAFDRAVAVPPPLR